MVNSEVLNIFVTGTTSKADYPKLRKTALGLIVGFEAPGKGTVLYPGLPDPVTNTSYYVMQQKDNWNDNSFVDCKESVILTNQKD